MTDPYHAQLWVVGDAIDYSSWLKGHAAGLLRKAPAEGKIRINLSLNELLQLNRLAHRGFQHMMPNFRGFEIKRFSGQDDAQDGAMAIKEYSNLCSNILPKILTKNKRVGYLCTSDNFAIQR
jgi:hypothetical protein